jgi:hypothetical protein
MARIGIVRRWAAPLLAFALLGATAWRNAVAQSPEPNAAADSDQDGIPDAVEQALLAQFAPAFLVGRHDCATAPAQFAPDLPTPTATAEDGTIYGQVFPAAPIGGDRSAPAMTVEIHYYHLWALDCGPHGHRLDTEHVAVLVSAPGRDPAAAQWKAVYWYAAAHENTICDVSQITRASTLHAEQSGARVWISPGKHASYLNEALCQAGCGADKCTDMTPLPRGRIVNLGEAGHPMNGSVFIASGEWPLAAKMTTSNFPPEALARLNQMPETDIAWFNPGPHPAQGIIADSSATEQAMAGGASQTTESLSRAGASTGVAISLAQDDTGNALQKTYRHTVHALGVSARHVGEAVHGHQKPEKPQ